MKKIELEIPAPLFDQLEKLRQQSGLTSFNDFVLAVLQDYVDHTEDSNSADDEAEIRKRLENLGYL